MHGPITHGPTTSAGNAAPKTTDRRRISVVLAAALSLALLVALASGCSLPKIGGGGGGADSTSLTFNPEDLIPATTGTTGTAEVSPTDTTSPTSAGDAYPTPEEAVQAVVGGDWVVSTAWMQGDEAEVWAGPPYSEFVSGFSVVKTSAGWEVVDHWELEGVEDPSSSGGYSGGSDDLVGGPWYPGDFPEMFELGSGLWEPFRTDSYPRPPNTSFPSSGNAWVVWDSVGRMLNDLKMGRIADATRYVTADFYQIFYFSLFEEAEARLREFELTGWEDLGDGFYAVWANLQFSPAGGGAYTQKAVFVGAADRGGVGIMLDVDLWEPVSR